MAEIVITAPSSAKEGDRVSVSARVTNISADSYPFRVRLYAVEDIYAVPAPEDLLGTFEATIGSGAYKTISGSFTMPAWDITVLVMVYRFIDYWDFDNYDTKVVSSIEAPVEPTYRLNVLVPSWAAGGYVDPGSGHYPAYSTVKLTAHPLSGYQFTGWGGDASGTRTTYNLYMNSDKSVEAYFEPALYPATDIKNIAIGVIGPEYPSADIKNIAIDVVGVEYPSSDIKNIAIGVVGVEYPSSDIKNIAIGVIPVGYIAPIDGGFVKIEITKPLPSSGVFGVTYKIEGSAKMFDIVGALPWLYAAVKKKEWYLPEIIEEVSYERGFPIPISGDFSIDFKPEKGGNYEVTVVATPAPLPLPVVGVLPVVGESGMMKIKVE